MPRPSSLEHLGQDLLMTPFFGGVSWATVDLVPEPAQITYPDEQVDLGQARGGDCLRQALVLRLLTPLGSLEALGHAGYGSRLHELVGQPNNRANRLRARAFVLQAVEQERRVAEIESLTVEPDAVSAHIIHIHLQVRPPDSRDPLALGLEVRL